MKIKDITDFLERIAPLAYQESYDNSGLLVGDGAERLKKILITLDVTEEVIDEAISEKCNLIIAHHPIIFSGLKKINGKNYVERCVIKAIRHQIAIYAIHTNLDNVQKGVNAEICKRIGLENCRILLPQKQNLRKLQTFIPPEYYEQVSRAIFEAGAGNIGNYSETSFNSKGTGTYRGNENARPAIGQKNKLEKVEEIKLETIFPAFRQSHIVSALLAAHPYEEVAYDVLTLENEYLLTGSGMIGTLTQPVDEITFLKSLKKKIKISSIRHTALSGRKVTKVAVCGGSGSFLLPNAIAAGADVFVTADFKYHDFFNAEGKTVVADIGHYESEQFTKDLIYQLISENFPIIAARISSINTNPIKYL